MAVVLWTEAQTKKALFLYFQLPFGQLDQRNPEIIALAGELGRTPSAVAMKLANFASLDPKIVESGRKGLTGASALDRKIWNQFHDDWTKLIVESGGDLSSPEEIDNHLAQEVEPNFEYASVDGKTSRRVQIEQRLGQNFFRRAVLANFNDSCCVTGILEPRLLIASHISPWSADIPNRHNPRNGLCLSATFDRAFDAYLMTVTPELKIRISPQLLASKSHETRSYFAPYDGQSIRHPTHIAPDLDLLEVHNSKVDF
ncbi:HNH endonuclease [Sphingopyxis sp.]|jgi:hypothetical protein|uniref:HNH endonuclease n=1 Tax=Sphingopyxis sp. TaxID=1908224 RepID=UPI002DFB7D00|nr:HNH endonuclease [Sphingopyxis sp.]